MRCSFLVLRSGAAVAASTCIGLVGCGGDSRSPSEAGPPAPPATSSNPSANALVTDEDVEAHAEGTPERAFMSWWRSAQYADFTSFTRGFVPSRQNRLRRDSNTRAALDYFSGVVRDARPRITGTERQGNRATVYTLVEFRGESEGPVESTLPRAFSMVRVNGTWRLTDDLFFQSSLPTDLRSEGVVSSSTG